MSCDIYAYIQIDEPTGRVSMWDLTADSIAGCKDYDFYAAIAGIRNRFGKPPLIPPRGLPPHDPMHRLVGLRERDLIGIGWLTLPEIEAAMAHLGTKESQRAEQVLRLLDVMRVLAGRTGKDKVRLIFGFSD